MAITRRQREEQTCESAQIEDRSVEELFQMAYADIAETAEDSALRDKRINGFSIAGFILSLFGPLAILGFIFSVIGLCRVKEKNSGLVYAIVGVVLSVVVLGIFCALCLSPYDPIAYFTNLF